MEHGYIALRDYQVRSVCAPPHQTEQAEPNSGNPSSTNALALSSAAPMSPPARLPILQAVSGMGELREGVKGIRW